MADRFTWSRRQTFSSLTVVAMLALAVGVSQGVAGSDGSVTVPVQYHNVCGVVTKEPYIGKARFTRSGSTLNVKVNVSGADPGTYDLELYRANPCQYITSLGKFKVDGSRSGSGTGMAYGILDHYVFVNLYDGTVDNFSLIAKV